MSWPVGGGEVGALLRAPGFEGAGIGGVAAWPQTLRHLLDATLASRNRLMVLWGPEMAVLYNDALIARHPGKHPSALGRPYAESWPAAWPEFAKLVERAMAGESLLMQETAFEVQREPRLEMFVDLSMSPLRDDAGRIAGVLCQSIDQTERVLAERREHAALLAYAEKSRLLEIVTRAGARIAGELDVDRVTQVAIDAGVALTGAQHGAFSHLIRDSERVRSGDILGDASPYHAMPAGTRSYVAVPVKSRSGAVIGGLVFGHCEPDHFSAETDDSLLALAAHAAVAIDNARLFQASEQEIERRATVEELLRELNETLEARVIAEIEERRLAEAQLLQAQKMETIGKLTGGVAHDFNNLLQVISGNLQLLARDLAGNERAERRVGNALTAVNRGAKLASQLLAFGRRQPLEPKVVNIGRFVSDMDDMLRRALGEAIEIETIVAGGLWNCAVDPAQIENALLNLAINARDAMDGAGHLTIEVGNASLDDAYARSHAEVTPGQYVLLAVTDTGSGIAPAILDQVFEPFFSTKAEGKGTGLGLSMVYGFVKQSGGHVKLYSELGQGTTVKIYLPRVRQRETLTTDDAPVTVSGGTETILVAEDDEGVRTTVVDLLTELGYTVLKAVDAQSALHVVESGVAIDLLFTDVVMPGTLKSPELARIARARLPELAVLFTSGYTENSIVHGGKLDAGVELLSKPYSREALARKIRQVLGARGKAATVKPPRTTKARKLMVLLVEDDASVRANTAEMLNVLGHLVVEAASAEEAVTALQTAAVDVLVTDLRLPGISGDAFAEQARGVRPDIGIVYATGSPEGAELSAESGAHLLRKPYDGAGLAAAVKAVAPGVKAKRKKAAA
jgi:signal transduction histidine kinase/DNA-binding response OmpR family regulator